MLTGTDQQIQIRLTTTEEEYVIEQNVFSVANTASAIELQDLVRNLLDLQHADIEFNFRVGEEFLQHSLRKYCEGANFSGEQILDVNYFPKRKLPEEAQEISLDDWVGGVTIANSDVLYTGLYNGQVVKIFEDGQKNIFDVHTKPIKDVCYIKTYFTENKPRDLLVTASLDQNLCFSSVEGDEIEILYTLKGHTETVTSCAVSPSAEHIASGSWDTHLKIWSTSLNEPCDEEQRKKRKKHTAPQQPLLRTPVLTLGGHTQVITGACWKEETEIVTVSHDMTVKVWDTQLMSCTNTMAINSALQCVDWSARSKLIATGSSDNFVRLFDPRGASGTIVYSTLIGHSMWVSGVAWSGTSDVELVSCSYDKSSLLWDIRSTKSPLSTVSTHEDKVLCVAWDADTLVTGGADNKLHISKL